MKIQIDTLVFCSLFGYSNGESDNYNNYNSDCVVSYDLQ
jgi:hypothetical protein